MRRIAATPPPASSAGQYQAGSDPLADQAIERMPALKSLLTQGSDEATDFAETIAQLQASVA